MNNMRYFLADPIAYEEARLALNAAWGLPSPGTTTALPHVTALPKQQERVAFSVDRWMCDMPPAPEMIAGAIASGDLAEIAEADFVAICQAANPEP